MSSQNTDNTSPITTDPRQDPETGGTHSHLSPDAPAGEKDDTEYSLSDDPNTGGQPGVDLPLSEADDEPFDEPQADPNATDSLEDENEPLFLDDTPEPDIDGKSEDVEGPKSEKTPEAPLEMESGAEPESPAEDEPEPEAEPKRNLDYYKQLHQEAIKILKAEYLKAGEDYDEFDDVHKDALADIKATLRNKDRQAQSYNAKKAVAQKEFDAIVKAAGGDSFVRRFADALEDMTVRERRKFDDAESRGDFSLTLKLAKEMAAAETTAKAARDKAAKLNRQGSPAPKPKSEPPKTISSGMGSTVSNKSVQPMFGLSDLGLDE